MLNCKKLKFSKKIRILKRSYCWGLTERRAEEESKSKSWRGSLKEFKGCTRNKRLKIMRYFRICNNVQSLGIMHTLRYSKIWIVKLSLLNFRKSVEFISDLFDYLFASVCPASKMGDCNPTMLEAEDSLAEIHRIYLEKLKQISSMLPAINLAP